MQIQVKGKPLKYARRSYQPGEVFDMPKKAAVLFKLAGRVTDAPIVPVSEIPAAPSTPLMIVTENAPPADAGESTPIPQPETQGESAKSIGEEKQSEADADSLEAPEPKSKRYKRRDMRPE